MITSAQITAAAQTIETLSAAIANTDTRLAAIAETMAAAQAAPVNAITKALALIGGTQPAPPLPREAADLQDKRQTLMAALELARNEHSNAVRAAAVDYNTARTAELVALLRGIGTGLQSTLEACDALKAFRIEAARDGVNAGEGGFPAEFDYQIRETLERYLTNCNDLSEELADRFAPAGADVRVVALADIDGAKAGEVVTLPGKVARLLMRIGRAEPQTNAQRLRKAVSA